MSLRHVCKDLHLIAQIRSDQHHDFTFHAAAERAQVEQDDSPSCNIRLNFPTMASQEDFQAGVPIGRRGDRNVPRRYLKNVTWLKVSDDMGYFIFFKGAYFPIKFNFEYHYWYQIKYDEGTSNWVTHHVAPIDHLLSIPENEIVPWSDWGPRDGDIDTDDDGEGVKYPEHQPSTHNSPTSRPLTAEPEEICIPANNQEDCQEEQLEGLASLIPSLTD